MTRLFTYVITQDGGFAPNPFHGVLTLNCCKPDIRRAAQVRDWVAGNTAANFPGGRGLLVYAMRVTAKMTMSEYDAWTRQNLPEKIPDWRGPYERRAGDSAYKFETDPPSRRPSSFHDLGERRRDLSGRFTLLSEEFYYLGGDPVEIPEHLRGIIHDRQGHRSNLNAPYVEDFANWIGTFEGGLQGMPHLAPRLVEIGRGGGPMRLVEDFTHPTPHDGRCRVRIYTDDELPVVICTDARDNPGRSITNAAEQIAVEVMRDHPEIFDPFIVSPLPGATYDKPFVWVEHYEDGARGTSEDRATFDLVEFGHYEPREVLRAGTWTQEIGTPSWSPLDREAVETLVGSHVDS